MKRTVLAHPENLWNIPTDCDATNGYGTKMSPCNQTVPVSESQQHIINPTTRADLENDYKINGKRSLSTALFRVSHVRHFLVWIEP